MATFNFSAARERALAKAREASARARRAGNNAANAISSAARNFRLRRNMNRTMDSVASRANAERRAILNRSRVQEQNRQRMLGTRRRNLPRPQPTTAQRITRSVRGQASSATNAARRIGNSVSNSASGVYSRASSAANRAARTAGTTASRLRTTAVRANRSAMLGLGAGITTYRASRALGGNVLNSVSRGAVVGTTTGRLASRAQNITAPRSRRASSQRRRTNRRRQR